MRTERGPRAGFGRAARNTSVRQDQGGGGRRARRGEHGGKIQAVAAELVRGRIRLVRGDAIDSGIMRIGMRHGPELGNEQCGGGDERYAKP